MKKLFLIAALMCAVFCSSCSDGYDDSALRNDLNSLEARVAKLEEMCKQMNTNISSLQTIVNALQNNDYVTGVTPITKNGEEIGYTITFSKSKPITIYHGEDGADGKDGNSVAPVIGVKKHTDGIYYWTLDGEWLTDANGNKIKAQGADGTEGTNGEDGVTPKLKIEDDYWYVSYDNGKTWEEVGKATGEDGADGDTIFTTIDTSSSSDYVIFTLSDGSQIKLPTWTAFEALRTQCNQMNTNIQSLQALINVLESHDYIQSVTPLMENGTQVGYTITFAYSNPITIYSNASGSAAPVIGVKKDTDNVYYWTLNGEWLLDDEGNKIKAEGKDGSNGTNGSDGNNGEDGITPKLKIEEGYWYVSYDNGTSWTKLGKATGADGADGADGSDGADGTDGEDGDNIFSSVTQDEEYVYFNLADGTIIILSKQDKENIQFEDLRVKMLCCTRGVDKNNDGEISYSEAAAITGLSTVFKGNTDIVAFTELKYFTGLTKIDDNAFRGCTNLWKITFPDNIKEIGEYAFYECNDLQIIDIPNGVTKIGLRAFSGCSKVKYVSLPHSVITLGNDCFDGVTGELIINCSIPDATFSSSYWNGPFINSKFSSLIIGDEVDVIGEHSFNDVTSLTSLTMGNNVKNIGEYAFSGCTNLKSEIKIPQSVISMGRRVFGNCDSVTKIFIECENVGKEAFSNCDSLSSVALSESVKIISENAFYGCPAITTIILPGSITNIEKYAFNCKNLKIVYCKPITPPTIDSHIFGYDATINTIYVPTESVDLYKSAINWSNHFDIIQGKEF